MMTVRVFFWKIKIFWGIEFALNIVSIQKSQENIIENLHASIPIKCGLNGELVVKYNSIRLIKIIYLINW